jgi:hypothetical protein
MVGLPIVGGVGENGETVIPEKLDSIRLAKPGLSRST